MRPSVTAYLKRGEPMEDFWLWLCSIPGVYRLHMKKLLGYFETPQALFYAAEREISSFEKISQSQRNAILKSRSEWNGEKERNALQRKGIVFISCGQREYPSRLLEICDYPYGLFVKGELPKDEEPSAAVVGARLCSAYGKHLAQEIGTRLAGRGVQIVSGMARGIDGIAQRAALAAGGKSYGILGCGTDVCYPRENMQLYLDLQKRGGVVSEYPPGTVPAAFHFPMRNRIISGLSDLVIVVEAREKSGSLITADLGIEQGRDVVAVPGRACDGASLGCNRLIAQGADIFLSFEQLEEKLKINARDVVDAKKSNIPLETEEELVYSVLEFHAKNLQTIADETGLAPQEAASVLVRLVLRGLAGEHAQNYYAKI